MDEVVGDEFPEEALESLYYTIALDSIQILIFFIGFLVIVWTSYGLLEIKSLRGRWVIFICSLVFLATAILDLIMEYYLDFEVYFYIEPLLLIVNSVSFLIATIYFRKLAKLVYAYKQSANKAM